MSAQDVARAVHAVVQTISKTADQVQWNEMTTRYAVVDPILRALGWRIRLPWECQLQYQLGQRGSVDYALLDRHGSPAILIDVQPMAIRRARHQSLLWWRVRGLADTIAVLTYGLRWEIYDLGVRERRFDQRRVACLVLDPDTPDSVESFADELYRWLAKERHW